MQITGRWLTRAVTWPSAPVLLVASSPLLLGRPAAVGSFVAPADVPYLVAILACWLVGVVLTGRAFGQLAGWAFVGLATTLAWSGFVDSYADRALDDRGHLPAGALAATLSNTSFVWWFVFLALVLQLTPGPRASSRFRRRLLITTVASGAAFQFAALLRSTMLEAPYAHLRSPWAISSLSSAMAAGAAIAIVAAGCCLVASVVLLVGTWRRTEGESRQQLLWLVAGAFPLAPCLITSFAVSYAGYDDVAGYLMSAAIVFLAAGAAFSVLRYRLYDVERVVTTSAAFAIASASVIVIFVLVIVVISRTTPIDARSQLPTVLATLAGAAAARASYVWGRGAADRRINRVRFDAVAAVRSGLSSDTTPDLDQLIPVALHDPRARVLYPARDGAWVTSDGRDAHPGPGAVEVRRHGVVTATIDFDPDKNQRGVVEAVAREASAEIDNGALRTQLARQVELIGESRSRLATAHLEERRRIERDLHDGAQQRLLAVALQLQSAMVNGGHEVLRDEVKRAITEIGVTVQELRDLAAGLQPAALAGGGLLAAVADLVGRIPVDIGYSVVDRRFPASVEGAAWFVIAEGVTNAVKHAGVNEVSITVTEQRSAVRVTVSDRGAGGADARGNGLQGLADRVSALRGTLCVRETSPHGTTLGGAAMRIVIADDSALLREGLARLLTETGVEVCETLADASQLADAVDRHRPDVAIVDIRMPPTFTYEGAAAAMALRTRHPGLGILLLSQAVETHFAAQLLERHAAYFGYLLKDRVVDVSVLRRALDTIAAGGIVLDPDIVRSLMGAHVSRSPVAALSERERDVLALMTEGLSNVSIAERLVLSLKTVESHNANIFRKLQLNDDPSGHRRVLAVLAALRHDRLGNTTSG